MTAYSLDSSWRRHVLFAVAVVGLVVGWGASSAVGASGVKLEWWMNLPGPFAFAAGAYVLFDKLLWRVPPFKHMHDVPDLNGAWVAELRSSYDDYKLVRPGTATIVQTWSRMLIEFDAPRSTSRSTCLAMFVERGSVPEIEYGYHNKPKADALETMNAATGFAVLALKSAHVLEGEYFTGRGRERHGRLLLQRQAKSAPTSTPTPVA